MSSIVKKSLFIQLYALVLLFATGAASAAIPGNTVTLAPMLEKAIPSVVNISASGRVQNAPRSPLLDDPFFRHFFDVPNQPKERVVRSLGSGVVINAKEGYILTNSHVIADAEEITVTLHSGRRLEGEIVGVDPDSDVAVIRVDTTQEPLIALPLGDSSNVRVGDFVVAIGSPFGLRQTVTSGIVSALGRDNLGIEGYENFIQTDASINPGNSGGALVNLSGQLVGINTAIVAPSGGNVGIGFAIPVNMAISIADQITEFGEVQRGQLGVMVQDVTQEIASAFDLKDASGALISQVVPNTAAERAGLQSGDIVTKVDGQTIRGASDLRNRIGLMRVDTETTLTVIRNGKESTMKIVITAPSEETTSSTGTLDRLEGVSLGNYEEILPYHGTVKGVEVLAIETGTDAERAGLIPGDIIISANRQPVSNISDLESAVGSNSDRLLLNVIRGPGALFIVIQ